MKIIDKTPFQNEQGQIEFMGRVQGMLKYGGNWYPELEAQKAVIGQLGMVLEKGFVLLRNFNLPGSEIIVPILLIGVNGLTVIYVTHLKGRYEAQGDEWNRVDQGRSLPERANLVNRVMRLARATQVYLERQGINIPGTVTPVLMAAYPGLQIETMRPVVRVIMSDAIKQFAGSLVQGRPALRPEQVYDLADRITNPVDLRDMVPTPIPAAAPTPTPAPAPAVDQTAGSRARAIFDASQSTPPFDPSDLSFALEDAASSESGDLRAGLMETSRSQPQGARPAPVKKGRILGMKPLQFGCLALMTLVECLVLAGAGAYYFFFLRP